MQFFIGMCFYSSNAIEKSMNLQWYNMIFGFFFRVIEKKIYLMKFTTYMKFFKKLLWKLIIYMY